MCVCLSIDIQTSIDTNASLFKIHTCVYWKLFPTTNFKNKDRQNKRFSRVLEGEHEHTVQDISWAVSSDLPLLLRFSQRTEWSLSMQILSWESATRFHGNTSRKLWHKNCCNGWALRFSALKPKKGYRSPAMPCFTRVTQPMKTSTAVGLLISPRCAAATAHHLWKLSCHGPNPRPSVVVDAILLLAVDASGWESWKALPTFGGPPIALG